MWIAVCIDMPTRTKPARLYKAHLTAELMKDGFEQVSNVLFVRHCTTLQNATRHKSRIQSTDFHKSAISIMLIADQQMLQSYHWNGRTRTKNRQFIPTEPPEIEFL